MIYACNEEGVGSLKKMASLIDGAVDEIKNATDTVQGVANDNKDALGPHVGSLNEALDDIKSSLERSTGSASDISSRLNSVADKYQAVIDDDPFGGDSSGGSFSGAAGAMAGAAAGAALGAAAGSASSGTSSGASAGSSSSAGGNTSGLKPVSGASPRNLSSTQYGYSVGANGEAVYDSPMEMDQYLYASQGSADGRFGGTCGLCSCANILRLAGVDLGEGDMINYAAPNGLCMVGVDPFSSGGTGPYHRQKILEHFGIKSDIVSVPMSGEGGSSLAVDKIADYVSSGKGVILSVHAGILDPAAYNVNGFGDDYHAVTVTSVKRNAYGNPIGFYICDSNQGTKYYDADTVRRSLTGNDMNVTQQIIR